MRLVACGVCHTDLYTASGVDPSGYAPTVLGHEGAGVVEKLGPGVSSLVEGDHVVTLFSPQCRECEHCRSGRHEPLPGDPRAAEQGLPTDGTTRLSRDGEPIRHFMGTSTFAEYTVMPEIALARAPRTRRSRRPACLPAVSHGPGGGDVHAGSPSARPAWCSGPGWSARRRRRLPPAGGRADHLRRSLRGPPAAGEGGRAPPTSGRPARMSSQRIQAATRGSAPTTPSRRPVVSM